MKIVIIGSGNTATILGRLCLKHNHQIIEVVSRNIENASILASELECKFSDFSTPINDSADIYIVAITDSFLFEFGKKINLGNKLVVHTAGCVEKDVLKNVSNNFGSLYPMQSLRKEKLQLPNIPFMIEGNSSETTTRIQDFANSISTSVIIANDATRSKMHLASVFVNNFTNHLYKITDDFCQNEQLDFKLLQPIIEETAFRLRNSSAKDMQTGPAHRNDVFTLDKHLGLLSPYKKMKYLYLKLTDSIMNPSE